MNRIRHFRELEVYQLAMGAAMKLFVLSKRFPLEEKYGSSGKCVLSVSTDKNIIGFMQRHDFEFKEFDIPETIGHFVQGFDLVIGTFQRPG